MHKMSVFLISVIVVLTLVYAKPVKENDTVGVKQNVKPIVTQSDIARVKGQIKTNYDINGRPVNQAQNAKGFHRVIGSTKLSGGVDTVTLNTSMSDGRQDVSFISSGTYHGLAWSLSASNDSTYKVIPLSGTKFIIKSSGGTDTATVKYIVSGE